MFTEIRADEISSNLFATFAPGKKCKEWNRDLDMDLKILKDRVDLLVCLIPDDELKMLKIDNIKEKCQEYDIDFYHFPFTDDTVPKSIDIFDDFIEMIHKISENKKVCVFCRGGLGRTGLVCASLLLKRNLSPSNAISLVRIRRQTALGRKHQQLFVHKYNNYLLKKKKTMEVIKIENQNV